MKTRILITILIGIIGLTGILHSDAFNGEGMIIEVPGQTMDISQNIISPGETMFVNGSFKQPVGDFTTNIFKNYEDSRKLVLTLNPTTNESGDFNFNFTIPQYWELGNYYMILENGLQFMDWDFAVRKNYVGASLDPIVYPIQKEILSPLKQIKSGVPIDEIECKDGLVLVTKNNDSPACVTESTKKKLIERGWTATKITKPVSNNYNPYEIRCSSGVIPYIPKNWHETEKQPSDEQWENLGLHLMKDEFYKQLKQQNIIFEPACFGIYKGGVEWSYPPRISMCTVVSELDGDKIYLEGTVHGFDVINFEMTRTIPYQCDELHAGCFCNIENEN